MLLADRHHETDRPPVVVARTTSGSATPSPRSRSTASASCPVSEEPEGDDVVGLVGSISEKGLLDRAYRDPSVVERTVGEVMDPPLPLVEASATLDEAFALLSGGASALVAVRGERPAGVVTKLDLLEYLAHHSTRAASSRSTPAGPRRVPDTVRSKLHRKAPGPRQYGKGPVSARHRSEGEPQCRQFETGPWPLPSAPW